MNKRELLIDFLDSIRDYEREAGKSIGMKDERETSEFVDIYLQGLQEDDDA